jgi:peptide/nickel transport system substrate-binding protein
MALAVFEVIKGIRAQTTFAQRRLSAWRHSICRPWRRLAHANAAAAVAFCLSASLLTGCGQSENPQAPKQIVVGMSLEPLGFFPLRALDSGSYYAQTLVYEGLVRYGPNLEIVPALASSFVISDDGLTYTFKLRDSARFSDGSPVTYNDIESSYKLVQSKSSPFKTDYGCIETMEHPDASTFILHLNKRSAPLLARLAELRILPASITAAHDLGKEKLSRTPVGSGPYRLVRWESGLELVFAPNEYYWGKKPQQGLVWRIVPDKTLMAMALSRHELDVANLDATSWEVIKNRYDGQQIKAGETPAPGIQLDTFAGTRTMYLGFNTKRKPFDNALVRQAICMGINRNEIARFAFKGLAVVPPTDVFPGSWAFNPDAVKWPYSLTDAQTSLTKAGFKFIGHNWRNTDDDKLLAFRILTIKDYQDVAQIVSDSLKSLNIPSEVQVVEYATLRQRYLQKGDFDAILWSRSYGPDPECSLVWGKAGPLNYSKFDNSRVEELIQMGISETDQAKRKPYYKEIQSILAKELPWVFLVQPELLVAHWSNIGNIKEAHQMMTGLPWDNPLFNAADWQRLTH